MDGIHTTRASTGNIDPSRVGLVLADGVQNHVRDSLGVTTTIVAETLLARHVPAGTAVRGRRPDGDVALLVRALLPWDLAVLEVALCRRLTRVDDDHKRWVLHDIVRNVGVPKTPRG